MQFQNGDTIVALSTPQGQGAIGIVRLSGSRAIEIVSSVFSKSLDNAEGYTVHFGKILKGEKPLDEVLVMLFKGPRSYTKEDVVEISFHGSSYILREALEIFVAQGARLATAGEFTQRAFLNGAMDLAQAEAVADLIASNSASMHALAFDQMRGGISDELKVLREKLLNFTSLIELELDFGEEDVEFADRKQLDAFIEEMLSKIAKLIKSFSYGNAIKQGVPTTIIGKPNAGKSTLLNALLNDNRAIVSDIPGTTRDVIEDRLVISGIEFRLQDTAGLRETKDEIEAEGVERSLGLAKKASLVLYVFDAKKESLPEAQAYVEALELPDSAILLFLANKSDLLESIPFTNSRTLNISAKSGMNLDTLKTKMVTCVNELVDLSTDQSIITNVRHLMALRKTYENLVAVKEGFAQGLSGDLVTVDIRAALFNLGEITGEISTDEVLGNIFSKFCIGK